MKKIFLILLVIFVYLLSACKDEEQIMSHPSGPLTFNVSTDIDAATAEDRRAEINAAIVKVKNEADFERNWYALDKLNFYYAPVYAEQKYLLNHITLHGGANGSVVLVYYLENDSELTYRKYLTLNMDRDNGYGAVLLEDSITRFNLQPFEDCEGVYYYDAYNGEHYSTHFYWVYDSYCFEMLVCSAIMDEIKESDPEALKGALFELEKVELE